MRLQSLLARMPGSRTATRLVQRTWQQIVPSSPTIPAADRSASIDNLREIFRTIGIDKDYSGMSFDGLRTDVTGWGSTHRIFQRVLSQARPGLVIEVGSWKGASVIHIAQRCRELGLATRFICVVSGAVIPP